eukprot:CAMPEP_0184699580 /NCGR_PEP_ID=MMETSP0313-20130426/5813_1 /TAXON_ID=2792 /ORGANISM="Porphyridium aerugineum, Strain SAG 1380-2" /LENGTH=475 /DNA_ID=CAMNT_0027158699 /DNA_START=365 /DNA_END=1792 /DNA_ORIENTATION=-
MSPRVSNANLGTSNQNQPQSMGSKLGSSKLSGLFTPRGSRVSQSLADDDNSGSVDSASMRGPSKKLSLGGNLMKTALKNTTRIGQHPFQFHVDIQVESVDKFALPKGFNASTQFVVAAIRGEKTVSSKPFTFDVKTNKAVVNDTLSMDVTMFRQRPDDADFCPKEYKICIRPFNPDPIGANKEKSVSKIMVDLAEYVAVPSGSRRLGAGLSNGATLVIRIESQFLAAGRSSRSGSTRSLGSRQQSEYADSSVGDADESSRNLADLDDLDDLEDGDNPGSNNVHDKDRERSKSRGGIGGGIGIDDNDDDSKLDSTVGSNFFKQKFQKLSFKNKDRSSNVGVGGGASGGSDPQLVQKLSSLEQENQRLEKENDTLICSLAARSASKQGDSRKMSVFSSMLARKNEESELRQLIKDNQTLKLEVKELKKMMESEKEVDEIIDELKRCKMELAIAYLEKENLHLELLTLKRQAGGGGKK